MNEVDGDKLNGLIGKMLGDLGGAFSVPTVRIGYRLGLFDALHKDGPATAAELAKRTGLAARYVREWALAQAANGYIMFNAADEHFSLTPEQAMVFTVKNSPVYLEGAFDLSAAMVEGQSKVEAAFRSGAGVAWGDRQPGQPPLLQCIDHDLRPHFAVTGSRRSLGRAGRRSQADRGVEERGLWSRAPRHRRPLQHGNRSPAVSKPAVPGTTRPGTALSSTDRSVGWLR